jgi:NAD(P)-dependent dehydrogenase (short-subunit alcohol dehydrogenase family)
MTIAEPRELRGPLAGTFALIVGGGSGIGLGTAKLLACDGATVTIAGRTKDRLEAARKTLTEEGLDIRAVPCDAMEPAQVQDAVDFASDAGRLHIAVVVPGGASFTPILFFEDEQFGHEVDQNIRPVFLTLKYAGRSMVRAGGGSFVAVSSTASLFSARFLASYCAGKAAVDKLVQVAADELGEAGIRVNSVRPGLTRTDATVRQFSSEQTLAEFVAGQAIGRPGEIIDIAQAIRYLAGPESSWVTGQSLAVDGGHTLRSFPDQRKFLELPDWRELRT